MTESNTGNWSAFAHARGKADLPGTFHIVDHSRIVHESTAVCGANVKGAGYVWWPHRVTLEDLHASFKGTRHKLCGSCKHLTVAVQPPGVVRSIHMESP